MKKYWLLVLFVIFVVVAAVITITDISNKRQECYKVQDPHICNEVYG